MRLFFAFELPEEVRTEMASAIEDFRNLIPRGVKWVESDNLHITLLFLGDVAGSLVSELAESAEAILSSIKPFVVYDPRIELVPGGQPKVIWVRYDTDRREVYRIPARLGKIAQERGIRLQKKHFKPHVTLGRPKIFDPRFPHLMKHRFRHKETMIEHAGLWSSQLRPEGPFYSLIESYTLDNTRSDNG